jgi:hypothetical protein
MASRLGAIVVVAVVVAMQMVQGIAAAPVAAPGVASSSSSSSPSLPWLREGGGAHDSVCAHHNVSYTHRVDDPGASLLRLLGGLVREARCFF